MCIRDSNHIDHVVKLIGVDHVGIGSDADLNGYDDMPADQYKACLLYTSRCV